MQIVNIYYIPLLLCRGDTFGDKLFLDDKICFRGANAPLLES